MNELIHISFSPFTRNRKSSSSDTYCFFLTQTTTNAALDAVIRIYYMGSLFFSGDSLFRAFYSTQGATVAKSRVNEIFEKIPAHAGRTFLIKYMGLVFISKVAQGTEHRIWC